MCLNRLILGEHFNWRLGPLAPPANFAESQNLVAIRAFHQEFSVIRSLLCLIQQSDNIQISSLFNLHLGPFFRQQIDTLSSLMLINCRIRSDKSSSSVDDLDPIHYINLGLSSHSKCVLLLNTKIHLVLALWREKQESCFPQQLCQTFLACQISLIWTFTGMTTNLCLIEVLGLSGYNASIYISGEASDLSVIDSI